MFETNREDEGSVGFGAIIAAALFVVQTGIILLVTDSPSVSLEGFFRILAFVPPLSQFLYVLPLYIERKRSGKPSTSHGLLGGAIVMGAIHLAIFGGIELFK